MPYDKAEGQLSKPSGIDRLMFVDAHECVEIEVGVLTFRRIWFGGRDLRFKICSEHDQLKVRDLNVSIDYDPVSDEFVGCEDDPSLVPIPGGKRVKRDALAALIEAIAVDMAP